MCGIAGIWAYNGAANPVRAEEITRICARMRTRGPDGEGYRLSSDGRIGLGHRRLAIVDPSPAGAQPMVSADGRLMIVFNGEIYNHRELRRSLEQRGREFRSRSDTEVLLHLFADRGAEMVHELRGMFAFAIWDDLHRRLFLARDPYGIKPLYTADDGWTFRFASQVKAILAGGGAARDCEPAGIVGFHLWGSVPEPFTFYREIRALPAGHTQWVDAAGPRLPQPYWSISAELARGSDKPLRPNELQERVRAATLDSVRAHLVADVEVGAFLSGGVDSGALLGLMRDTGNRDVKAFTVALEGIRGTALDEVPAAARVARRYEARHVVREVSRREILDHIDAILDAMDQPSIDGVNMWLAAKAAAEAGLKVVVAGTGGDELLAGYASFRDVPAWHRRYGMIAAIPGAGRLGRTLIGMLAPGLARRRPKAAGMLAHAGSWAGAYLLRRGLHLPHELGSLLDEDLAREGLRRLRPLSRLTEVLRPDPGSDVARVCALESAHYLCNQLLRDADWAGMAQGVEIRLPLVDAVLLRQLAPVVHLMDRGAGKAALARAPSLPLPAEVATRPKTGFSVPSGFWLGGGASDLKSGGLAMRGWSDVVFRSHRCGLLAPTA